MLTKTWSVLTTAAVTLLSTAAVLTASPASSTTADPLAGAPAVGECRDYTVKDASSPYEESAAVDCAGPHSGVVVHVAEVPSTYDLSGTPNAQLVRFAQKTCESPWRKTIGATHAQEHLVPFLGLWFIPTTEDVAAGARWIRCDVTVLAGKKLGDLPTTSPFVTGTIDRSIRKCLDSKTRVTSCADPHTWISRGIISVPKGPYSVKRQDAVAQKRCQGTLDRSDRQFLWLRISESAWKSGERHVVCFGSGR